MAKKIVIIGAGPGGLMAAAEAAKLGGDVLVLEKEPTYQRKVCAETVTGKTVARFPFVYESVERMFPSARLVSYNRVSYLRRRTPFLLTIDRAKLDAIQTKLAQVAGTVIKRGQPVSKIGKDFVQTKNGEKFKFDYLIGADGNRSIVRKHLNIPVVFYGVSIQYRVPQETIMPAFFMNPKLWGHAYAWSFPHTGYTSVGTGYSKIQPGKQFSKNLKNLCRELNYPIDNLKLEADVINTDFRGYKFGNIFLVGESSGLISGVTGEGIYNALLMGRAVARQIASRSETSPDIQERMAKKRRHEMLIRTYYAWPGLISFLCNFVPELKTLKE